MSLSLTAKEQELAFAISHLITKSNKMGIDDSVRVEGNQGNAQSANKRIVELSVEAYKIWVSLFPLEHKEFVESTKFQRDNERTVKQSIKEGGIFSIAYPVRFEGILRILMPGVKVQDKRFYTPLSKKIPELRTSNYA